MFEASEAVSWRVALPHSAVAVPMARALVRAAFSIVGAPPECDTAELLTAELVTNAVEHTAGSERIDLLLQVAPKDSCQVEVGDSEPAGPGLRDSGRRVPDVWQEYGRGLLLIRSLSSAFGHRTTDNGKTVWFTLTLR